MFVPVGLRNIVCSQREAPREQFGAGIAIAPVARETIRLIVIRGTSVATSELRRKLATARRWAGGIGRASRRNKGICCASAASHHRDRDRGQGASGCEVEPVDNAPTLAHRTRALIIEAERMHQVDR